MTIEEKIQYAMERWNLTEFSELYQFDTRAVYQGKSRDYGDCIIKINQNADALKKEAAMLRLLDGQGCCKLYDYDPFRSILLEERIVPGTVLREEQEMRIRIHQFIHLYRRIHRTTYRVDTFPTYMDWLYKADQFMEKNYPQFVLTKDMHHAFSIGKIMFQKYSDRTLLHGDFHHDNILMNAEGEYQMIDPKGVLGPKIFDLPRFIMNELDPNLNHSGKEHIQNVIQLIADDLNYPVKDISQLFYMEVILGNCWCVEDGEKPDSTDIEIATQILKEIESR